MNKDIRYCNFPGYKLIKEVEVEMDGKKITTHYVCKKCEQMVTVYSFTPKDLENLCLNCYFS